MPGTGTPMRELCISGESSLGITQNLPFRRRESQSGVAIQRFLESLDCFAMLATTGYAKVSLGGSERLPSRSGDQDYNPPI